MQFNWAAHLSNVKSSETEINCVFILYFSFGCAEPVHEPVNCSVSCVHCACLFPFISTIITVTNQMSVSTSFKFTNEIERLDKAQASQQIVHVTSLHIIII